METLGIARYHLNFKGWPTITGMFEERNARGTASFPNQLLIQYRNTYDTSFNTGINPVFHVFGATVSLNPGVQFTIRRDSASPVNMNQDLFRQFLYLYTSSFGNWVAVKGSLIREAGPFTGMDLHSRDAAGTIEFQVGRPWGRTAMITGYEGRDILFRPLVREYYTTDMYFGIQHKFRASWTAAVLAEYLRAWRVQDQTFATAQAMRPAAQMQFQVSRNWTLDGNFALDRGEGFHAYDNIQSGLLISYVKPLHRSVNDVGGEVPVEYPLRFSIGFQQDQFVNFAGRGQAIFRPVVRLTIF